MNAADVDEGPGPGSTVLVIGATGTVGREVVRALLERHGVKVRVLVRSPERANLAAAVEVVKGDLRDADALRRAAEGVDAAFYVSPHEPDEEALAERFLAATRERVARVVFVGVHADGTNVVTRWLQRLVYGGFLTHYRPKFRLSERIRTGHPDAVILMPTNFYQNDEIFLEEALAGSFVAPLGVKGINRVDVRDLGDAAARVLTDRSVPAGAFAVVGPASPSGAECAETWAAALGRSVRYDGDDDALFVAAVGRHVSGKKHDDLIGSYRVLRKFHLPTEARDLAQTTFLLGRPPTPYAAYVRDLVASVKDRRAG